MNKIFLFSIIILFSSCASKTPIKKKLSSSPIILDNIEKETMAFINQEQIQQVLADPNQYNAISGLCHLQKFSEAFHTLAQLYSSSTEKPHYWNQVGVCYLLQKELLKAELFFNKAISLKNNFAPTLNNLGILHLNQNNDQKAAQAFKRAIQSDPNLIIPKINLANLYLKNNFFLKAQKIFSKLNHKIPGHFTILRGLALTTLYIGQYEKAYKLFNTIDNKNQKTPEIALNKTMAAYFAKDKEEAQKIFASIDQTSLGPPRNNIYGR